MSPLEINGEIFAYQCKRRAFSEENEGLVLQTLSDRKDETSTNGSSILNEYMSELIKLPEF